MDGTGTMRAIGLRNAAAGELSVLTIPVPAVGDDELLVRVRAVGVGSHDRWFRPRDARFPCAIGMEASGEIAQVGVAADGFTIGEHVMILSGTQPKGGTWAEFAAAGVDTLIRMPAGLGFVEAAAIPVAGSAALQGLGSTQLSRGDRLFIAGASGAIGTLAIQLAVARGYRVAASASRRNQTYLSSLGAELAVDYVDDGSIEHMLQWAPGGVDAVLAIQPGTGVRSQPFVRDGGRIITVSGDPFPGERGIHVEQMQHQPQTRDALAALAADVASGKIHVVIGQLYPFDRAIEALEQVETRHARGKIVLTLDA